MKIKKGPVSVLGTVGFGVKSPHRRDVVNPQKKGMAKSNSRRKEKGTMKIPVTLVPDIDRTKNNVGVT